MWTYAQADEVILVPLKTYTWACRRLSVLYGGCVRLRAQGFDVVDRWRAIAVPRSMKIVPVRLKHMHEHANTWILMEMNCTRTNANR